MGKEQKKFIKEIVKMYLEKNLTFDDFLKAIQKIKSPKLRKEAIDYYYKESLRKVINEAIQKDDTIKKNRIGMSR